MSGDHPTSEVERLRAIEHAPPLRRALGYFRLMGPGYLQSAMTLGGGTAFASIFAGAAFGYSLLWVAPLSMLLGIIVLAAVAHQTLSTDEDPFDAMKRYAGPFFAYAWGIGAVVSSIIWQFAQYGLAAVMLVLLAKRTGWENASTSIMALIALAWCVGVGLLYGRSPRLVRLYENILKGMVWLIILCFAYVVVRMGVMKPGALLAGLIPQVPEARTMPNDTVIRPSMLIVSGLAAAVGVNMVFVYPFSLRRRGWGREHRRLARMDLVFGMFVPFALAASLILIASASVLHYANPALFEGKGVAPDQVAQILGAPDLLGNAGVWVFSLGIIAMALSSITMQMLSSGFACERMFGWKEGTPLHVVGTLLPAIGVLGAVLWRDMSLWVVVPTNVVCLALLPLAYVGFIILQTRRSYLGNDTPTGFKAKLWLAGMIVATLVVVGGLLKVVIDEVPGYVERLVTPDRGS
jgi:Mn2+/Fe2+ NRAMP family transporter